MAIVGIGTDIVSTQRIERIQTRYPQRFAERILSVEEVPEFGASEKPALFLAKRFAAKEAAVKALGTGFRHGISFADFTVGHDAWGKPELYCAGAAADWIARREVGKIHLSLSDEIDFAVAFVIMENK